MRIDRSLRLLALTVLVAASPSLPASAQTSIRAIVLAKVDLDGEAVDAMGLETAVYQVLRERDVRIIDLDTALRAQAFALSDMVAAGHVPTELSVLNAHVAISAQILCSALEVGRGGGAPGTRRPHIRSFDCNLDLRVLRIDTGEEVHRARESLPVGPRAHVTAVMREILDRLVPPMLERHMDTWIADFHGDTDWEAVLQISGLRDRNHGLALARRLGDLPGASAASLNAFSTHAGAQVMVRGAGREALAELAARIEADTGLGLSVVHEAGRTFHLTYDPARGQRRRTLLLVEPPEGPPRSLARVVADASVEAATAALANVGYLEIASTERLAKGTIPSSPGAPWRRQMGRRAQQAETDVVAVVRLGAAGPRGAEGAWVASIDLLAADGGPSVATAAAHDTAPFAALDGAVRILERRLHEALAESRTRQRVGLPAQVVAGPPTRAVGVTVHGVDQIFPTRLAEYREHGIGAIEVSNAADRPLEEVRVELVVQGERLATLDVEPVPPGGSARIPARIDRLPDVDTEAMHQLQLAAVVRYRIGEAYGRESHHTGLVLHRRNALDWRDAASISAFVDPVDPGLRALATDAVAQAASGGGITTELARMAAVHRAFFRPPLTYVADPVTTSYDESIDDVQGPSETLARLAGDCDDLTVLAASLFESVGLATAILTTPGHVLVGVDSGLLVGGHLLLDLPASAFVNVDGALFVPLETTALGVDTAEAWRLGAQVVAEAGDTLRVYRTRKAWRRYPTAELARPPSAFTPAEASAPDVVELLGAMREAIGRPPEVPPWSSAIARHLVAAPAPVAVPAPVPGGPLAMARASSRAAAPALLAVATPSGGPKIAEIARAAVAEETDPLARALLVWLSGDYAAGVSAMGALCGEALPEACFNLAVMLSLETDSSGTASSVPLQVVAAASLLSRDVLEMLLDRGGFGMGDEAASEEASAEAMARRRLEEVLQRARERQAERREAGEGGLVGRDALAGRRGAPATSPEHAARLFFWSSVRAGGAAGGEDDAS